MRTPGHRDALYLAEEAAQWLMVVKDGRAADRGGFAKWLRRSPRHVEEFLLMTASDHELNSLDPDKRIDVDQLIADLNSNVVALEKPDVSRSRRNRLRWAAGIAAAAIGIAVITAAFFGPFSGRQTYLTTVGEQRAVQLDDGSVIHLNALSRLTVRLSDSRREVRLLQGEALFDVARDARRPFTVATDRVEIRALGTAFNVHRGAHDTRVAVLEGAVEVTPLRDRQPSPPSSGTTARPATLRAPARLTEGDLLRVAAGAVVTRDTGNTQDAVAWRQRLLVFRDSPLEEIAIEFNRYNHRKQVVIVGQQLRNERYGGTFKADEPLAFIEFLRRTSGLTVVEDGDRLVIQRR